MADANVMLVEGPDDWNVFFHLLKHHYPGDQLAVTRQGDYRPRTAETFAGSKHILFDIVQGDSIFRPKSLSAKLKASGLERLGIVVDADTDIQVRWGKLCDALVAFGYTDLPDAPAVGGTIIEQVNYPAVGIWVMPDNRTPGSVENFISLLKPVNDNLWLRAEKAVTEIPLQERLFKPQSLIKAHVHTWLAWQEEPGTPMGQAITKHYLNANAAAAVLLLDWLKRLFDLSG
jgi:hypothetical protein